MLKFIKGKGDPIPQESVPLELPVLAKDLLKNKRDKKDFSEEKFSAKSMDEPKQAMEKKVMEKPLLELHQEKRVQVGATQEAVLPKNTFFSDILDELNRETNDLEAAEKLYGEKLLSQDLLLGMKGYWEQKKGDIIFTTEEKKLKEKLLKQIKDLQVLESQWQNLHLSLIESEEKIRVRELELKGMLKDFKELCARHIGGKKKDVSPEQYFRLADGSVVKDLRELLFALKVGDDNLFRHHVNVERNDFAKWAADVLQDYGLADKLQSAFTRDDVVVVLEKRLNNPKL